MMTSNEYDMLMSKWISTMRPALQPSIDVQSQMSDVLISFRETLLFVLEPLNDITLTFRSLAEAIAEPLRILSADLNDSIFQSLQGMFTQLAEISKLYDLDSLRFPSKDMSDRFIDLSNEILGDFSSFDLPVEISEEVSKATEEPRTGFVTFDRMLAIIALIITIFSVVHDLLPDKSIQETNRKLQQLIEIQERQLELMEHQNGLPESSPE